MVGNSRTFLPFAFVLFAIALLSIGWSGTRTGSMKMMLRSSDTGRMITISDLPIERSQQSATLDNKNFDMTLSMKQTLSSQAQSVDFSATMVPKYWKTAKPTITNASTGTVEKNDLDLIVDQRKNSSATSLHLPGENLTEVAVVAERNGSHPTEIVQFDSSMHRKRENHFKPKAYTDPLASVPSGVSFDDLPVPIQVMEQYKKWHSVEALQKNPDLEHRKFAIGFYACPLQAGTRIHHFLNGRRRWRTYFSSSRKLVQHF